MLQKARWDFELFDDFLWYISPHLWTSLAADATATVAIDADGEGGILTLFTDTTDNNECAVVTTNELFRFAADRPFYAEARIQYSENDTNKANVAFGFADAFGANLIADNGASVGINSSGVLIYKLDGGTVWRCNSENNTVAADTVSDQTAGGTAYQRLGIKGRAVSGTDYELTYFLDDKPLTDPTTHLGIIQRLAYASATQMDLGVYVKTGGGAGGETVHVDYLYVAWGRAG